MSLRTYPLIIHPAFLLHIEAEKYGPRSILHSNEEAMPGPPRLDRAVDIAAYLGVSPDIIASMLRVKHRHYRNFRIRKRSGEYRQISSPKTFLKVVQWWILDTILSTQFTHECAYGFVKGRSFIDNARMHIGCRHLLNVDIENFFPSIRLSDVKDQFLKIGYSSSVSNDLTDLVSLSGFLPQGAPTSPYLSNLILSSVDDSLLSISKEYGLTYTRYADDLTFSSQKFINRELIEIIEREIGNIGFKLNSRKTKLLGTNQRKEVTGIIIANEGIALSREYLNQARSIFYRATMFPEQMVARRDMIVGTYHLIRQVGGRGAEKMLERGAYAIEKLAKVRTAR